MQLSSLYTRYDGTFRLMWCFALDAMKTQIIINKYIWWWKLLLKLRKFLQYYQGACHLLSFDTGCPTIATIWILAQDIQILLYSLNTKITLQPLMKTRVIWPLINLDLKGKCSFTHWKYFYIGWKCIWLQIFILQNWYKECDNLKENLTLGTQLLLS